MIGGPYKVAYNMLILDKIDWTRVDDCMMKSHVYLSCVVWFKHATARVQAYWKNSTVHIKRNSHALINLDP